MTSALANTLQIGSIAVPLTVAVTLAAYGWRFAASWGATNKTIETQGRDLDHAHQEIRKMKIQIRELQDELKRTKTAI